MNNAEKFKQIFGLYATELWSMPESDFLEWLNRDVETTQIDHDADIGKKVSIPCAHENDLIFRQAAIDELDKGAWGVEWDKALAKAMLENLPSAEPERKQGEWIRYGEDGEPNDVDTVFWQCDQCLNTETGRRDKPMDFCPNCGADMRSKEGDACTVR